MNMIDSKYVEIELFLWRLVENQNKLVIQVNDSSHLFIRYEKGYDNGHNKVIIVMEHGIAKEFETIREMVSWLMDKQNGHYAIFRFSENLHLKMEEYMLNGI
jgi:hypothetical protein